MSPISFAMLSGAGVVRGTGDDVEAVNFHVTTRAIVGGGAIDLSNALSSTEVICDEPGTIFVIVTEEDGSVTGELLEATLNSDKKTLKVAEDNKLDGTNVLVDYYVVRSTANTTELQIDAENFAGSYYVEADTLFRRQSDGMDLPAALTFPNAKIQSNFTFQMSSTGDPSTFSFVMDCMPGYTLFDKTKRVLGVMQVADDTTSSTKTTTTAFPHTDTESKKEVA